MSHRPKYRLAKSADTGACGNKAGLPSTVGVSLAQRRSFMTNLQWTSPCCKSKLPDGCRGPADRRPISVKTQETVLSTTFDYDNSVITVSLSVGKGDGKGNNTSLEAGDFTVVAPTGTTPATAGLVFQSGNEAGTTASFRIENNADAAVTPNTLAPGTSFKITLNDGVKSKTAKTLEGASISTQVVSSTKIKILSLTAHISAGVAVVQFDSTVSDSANNALVASDFSVDVGGTANAPTDVVFIGDQVGGITYKITHNGAFASDDNITITSDATDRIHETSNGLTISEDKAGALGNSYTATSTTTSDNPRKVA